MVRVIDTCSVGFSVWYSVPAVRRSDVDSDRRHVRRGDQHVRDRTLVEVQRAVERVVRIE